MSVQQIQKRLQAIAAFVEPFSPFVNCHMVNYLTDSLWNKFIPVEVQNSVDSIADVSEVIDEIFWKQSGGDKFGEIAQFVEHTKQFRLENISELVTSKDDLYKFLGKEAQDESLSIKEFMSEKKRHEVEITADLIANLLHSTKQDFYVIDAGDGKGYLSSRLALQYGLRVLGVDSNDTNTQNALKRNQKLERAWNGITTRASIIQSGEKPPRRGKKPKNTETNFSAHSENYKTINKFITPDVNFPELLQQSFSACSGDNSNLCLTGLHTCGNLAPTCLKVFTTQKDFQILCNIGCCYHLLDEEFAEDEYAHGKRESKTPTDFGFPLSDYLKSHQFRLGRNARMLASQSIQRTTANQELSHKSLAYRALLEVVIKEIHPNLDASVQVGKLKNYTTFREYLQKCEKKLNLNLSEVSDEDIRRLEQKFERELALMDLFYLIRMSFAPILEAVILLDRLLYLKENGVEKSFLVPLFDPVISPRCFCIVAIK